MRSLQTFLRRLPVLMTGGLALGGCQDDTGLVGLDGMDISSVQNPTQVLRQVDRFGIPAVNTVFIPSALKDAFNLGAPADDPATFGPVIETQVTTVYGGSAALASAIADLVTPDIQPINTAQPSAFLNGRRLQDDVITTELMVLFDGNAALNDDHVDANDMPFLNTFPYLATPHLP